MLNDYANFDGRKIQRIMSGGDCIYHCFINGVISRGGEK